MMNVSMVRRGSVASRWQNKRLEGRSLATFREKVRAEKNYDAALHFKQFPEPKNSAFSSPVSSTFLRTRKDGLEKGGK